MSSVRAMPVSGFSRREENVKVNWILLIALAVAVPITAQDQAQEKKQNPVGMGSRSRGC